MKKRKVIKYILIVVIIIAIIIGIVAFFVNRNKKEVPVYSIRDLAMENYWENSSNSEGMVTEDQMQAVYLSSTQQVEKIAVTEGQTVKKGDVLLKYSTTLSNIELEKKELEIKKAELNLSKAQKELEQIRTYQPGVPIEMIPGEETVITTSKGEMADIDEADGTEGKPYLEILGKDEEIDDNFIKKLFDQSPDETQKIYVIVMSREKDSYEGDLIKATKFRFTKKDSSYSIALIENYTEENDPLYPNKKEEEKVVPSPQPGDVYSASDLQKMILDKEKEISDTSLNIKMAKNEYNKIKNELKNTVVYSKYNGTVKTVLDINSEEATTKPIIVVTSGGGYNIQGRIGELDLDKISVGQEVNVQSYESGTFAVGTITKISEYPMSGGYSGGMGNNNVSYYPYIVRVSEDESFREGEYVSLSLVSKEENSKSFYLAGAFIISENGKNYAYVQNEDNKLEKREVGIGKNMQGMLEIKGGISKDERIAFPYGKNIKQGAKTREASLDELYTYY